MKINVFRIPSHTGASYEGSDMPAAYSPSKEGLNFEEASALMTTILKDQRVKGIEVTEFLAKRIKMEAVLK